MPSTISVLAIGLAGRAAFSPSPVLGALAQMVPASAQIIDQKVFNVLDSVPPPVEANDSTVRYRIRR
jgi:gluconolactonase